MNTHLRRIARGLLALAILAPAACGGSDTPAAAAGGHARHAAGAPGPGEPADYSLYHLESRWRDQAGGVRVLGSLAGRVQVVALVYTHCGDTCRRVLMDMKRVEGEMEREHPGEVGFVLVSIDPERDMPDRLRGFAEGARLDPARWTLLSGSDEDVLELAALLGVKYRRERAAVLSHSNVITVLGRGGEVAHQQLGLGPEEVGGTVEAVREAVRAPL